MHHESFKYYFLKSIFYCTIFPLLVRCASRVLHRFLSCRIDRFRGSRTNMDDALTICKIVSTFILLVIGIHIKKIYILCMFLVFRMVNCLLICLLKMHALNKISFATTKFWDWPSFSYLKIVLSTYS